MERSERAVLGAHLLVSADTSTSWGGRPLPPGISCGILGATNESEMGNSPGQSDLAGTVRAINPNRVIAPPLSRYSFQLPHFGDCTHDGQPSSHGHAATRSSVARTCRAAASNASSAIPAPPG